jgi:RecA-family ATPase
MEGRRPMTASVVSVPYTLAGMGTFAAMPAITDKPAIGPKAPLFDSLSSLLANPRPQRWLVKGLIEAPSTVMGFGPSGCGKTFIVVDLAGATATGGEWMGRQVSAGPVYYIAGEGRPGLLRRFKAWQLKRRVTIPEDRLFLSVVPIELNAAGAAEVTAEAERRAQESGEPPALLIVDTLSRMMPAGGDENSVKDMMAFVKAVDQIRDRFDCVAVIVHHTGVADDKRARGSTSLKAAMDAELCITKRGAIRTAEWIKLKDLPEELHPQEFALEPELLGQDDDGNLITSAVVEWRGETTAQTSRPLTRTENLGLETLRHSITEGYSATLEAWRTTFYEKHWGDTHNTKKQAFARIRESLSGRGLIRIDGENYSIKGGTR